MAIKLHYKTVTTLLRKVLNDIMANPIFEPFYLVGGTSLSLRLGHRISVDIDLFTNALYGSLDFSVYEKFFQGNYPYCRKKDFWDLHELLNIYSIPQMLELHLQRHEYTHNREQIIANFTDFTSADGDIDPICLKGKEWELVKLDFVEILRNFVK